MRSSIGAGPVQALAAVGTALSGALRDGVEDLSHDQCAELMAQLRATAAQVDALTLAVLGKVDADGTFALDGAVTAGSWMRAVGHATPGEAARAVRTARALRSGRLAQHRRRAGGRGDQWPARGGHRRRRDRGSCRCGGAHRARGRRDRGRRGRAGHRGSDARLPARARPGEGRRGRTPALRAGRDSRPPPAPLVE